MNHEEKIDLSGLFNCNKDDMSFLFSIRSSADANSDLFNILFGTESPIFI